MATLTQFAYQALRDIGCLRAGQTTSTDILNDCLTAANQMLDSWQIDDLKIYSEDINTFNLIANQQSYKIGPLGADFTASRPTDIQDANIILATVTPTVRRPMKVTYNVDEWMAIAVQSIPNSLPSLLYYDKNFNAAQGWATIRLWPGPQAGLQLELATSVQLTQFADLVTNYNLPPGYAKAIRKNLAVEIAPMMQVNCKLYRMSQPLQPLLEEVKIEAKKALDAIISYNAPARILPPDPAFHSSSRRGGWNYRTGAYGRSGY